jgi:phage baseplate assembly protein V
MMLKGHLRGLVAEVGSGENLGKVRVLFPHHDDLVSGWLPVLQALTFNAKTVALPRKDTQVVVIPGESLRLDDAVVLGSLFSRPDPAPYKDAKIIGIMADDGTEIIYDPGKSTLTIQSPTAINITATKTTIIGDIDIEGNIKHKGNTEHTGNVTQTGNLTQTGSITTNSIACGGTVNIGSGGITMQGAVSLTGSLTASGSVSVASATIGGIAFATHKHPGVMSGAAMTGGPA